MFYIYVKLKINFSLIFVDYMLCSFITFFGPY